VAGGQISPSPIDFHRRPYNTLALPCERVMDQYAGSPGHSNYCYTELAASFINFLHYC